MTQQQQASQLLSQGINRMSVAPQPTASINPKSFFDFSSMPKQSSNLAGSSATIPQIPSIWKVEPARHQSFMEWIQQSPLKPVIEWGKKLINKVQTGIESAWNHKQINDDVLWSLWANFAQGDDIETIRSKYPELKHLDDDTIWSLWANFAQGDSLDTIKKKYQEDIDNSNKNLKIDHWNEIIDAILDPILQGGQKLLQSKKITPEQAIQQQEKEWIQAAIPQWMQNAALSIGQFLLWNAELAKNVWTRPLDTIKGTIEWTKEQIKWWFKSLLNNTPMQTAENIVNFAFNDPTSAALILEWWVQWVKWLKWLSRDVRSIVKNEPIQITNSVWETMTMWKRDFLKQTLDRVAEKTWQGIQEWVQISKQWIEWWKQLLKKATPEIKTPSIVQKAKDLINPSIDTLIDKSIKPTVVWKTTSSRDLMKFRDNVKSSVWSIIENKKNLKYINEDGIYKEWWTPETIHEFSQAVEQTKKSIYDKYNSETKLAWWAWAKVDTQPIVWELQKLIDEQSEIIWWQANKKYIQNKIDEIKKLWEMTPEIAQKNKQVLNERLQAYYRNPSVSDITKAKVDALINNQLWKQLDDAILSSLEWSQYRDLKNQYWSLLSIEKDVTKRALVEARKNAKWLTDFSDIMFAWDILSTAITWNPIGAIKWVAWYGIKEYYKLLNNVDNNVKNLFSKIEKDVGSNPVNSSVNATVRPSKVQPKKVIPALPEKRAVDYAYPPKVEKKVDLWNNLNKEGKPLLIPWYHKTKANKKVLLKKKI